MSSCRLPVTTDARSRSLKMHSSTVAHFFLMSIVLRAKLLVLTTQTNNYESWRSSRVTGDENVLYCVNKYLFAYTSYGVHNTNSFISFIFGAVWVFIEIDWQDDGYRFRQRETPPLACDLRKRHWTLYLCCVFVTSGLKFTLFKTWLIFRLIQTVITTYWSLR